MKRRSLTGWKPVLLFRVEKLDVFPEHVFVIENEAAAEALAVRRVVIAAPVNAAVSADSFKNERLATFGLSVTRRPLVVASAGATFLILLLAIVQVSLSH